MAIKPTRFLYASALLLAGAIVAAPAFSRTEISALSIMEKNYVVTKMQSLKSDSTMVLINDKGQTRTRKMTAVVKLQKNGIDSMLVVRFQFPADIKGTAFLQIEKSEGEDDLWIYLPALGKTRRLVTNNKKDSFFGSDFSYGDILLPRVDQYRHTLLRSEALGGKVCYVIESVPRDDAVKRDAGYGKKITWVRKDNFLEMKIEYFDVYGRRLKTELATEHKQVDPARHRWLALRRVMENHQTGHKTILTLDTIKVGMPIADATFSTRTLEHE